VTPIRPVTAFAAGCAAGAAAATAVDLLDGADLRWTVAASLLLTPPAAVLAAEARRTAAAPVAALCALGIPVGLVGALLGDRAGGTWWWLALESLWWIGLALAARSARPGLALLTALAAVSALAATTITGLSVPEPVASGAGLRVPITVAWTAWLAVDLALRPAARDDPMARPRFDRTPDRA
jgi:hypothetical protein